MPVYRIEVYDLMVRADDESEAYKEGSKLIEKRRPQLAEIYETFNPFDGDLDFQTNFYADNDIIRWPDNMSFNMFCLFARAEEILVEAV